MHGQKNIKLCLKQKLHIVMRTVFCVTYSLGCTFFFKKRNCNILLECLKKLGLYCNDTKKNYSYFVITNNKQGR